MRSDAIKVFYSVSTPPRVAIFSIDGNRSNKLADIDMENPKKPSKFPISSSAFRI
jgi:hypothetical protein